MKYSGSAWAYVGSAGFSPSVAYEPSMAIGSGGNIYVGFSDWSLSPQQKATVMKFNGSSWALLGTEGFSTGTVFTPPIAVNSSGTLYMSYRDVGLSNKAVLMTYSGSAWQEIVATGGFSSGACDFTSLALDGSGNPYVAFADGSLGDKVTVMHNPLAATSVSNVGPAKQNLLTYSNPNTGTFSIEYDGAGTCIITNLLGQVLRSIGFSGNNSRVGITNLKSGIYFVSMSNDPSSIQKIIVTD